MGFTVRGRIGEQEACVAYDEGQLSGTDTAVRRVHEVLERSSTLRLSPQDAERPASADDPLAVMAAIQEALDEVTELEGDYPMPEADSSAS